MGTLQRWFNVAPASNWEHLTDKQGRKFWFLWNDDWIPAIELWHFGRRAGYVNLLWEPPVCELADIFLDRKYRYQGLGTALMQEVIRHVRAKGLQSIIGYINPGADGESFAYLKNWYRQQGFTVEGQHLTYIFKNKGQASPL